MFGMTIFKLLSLMKLNRVINFQILDFQVSNGGQQKDVAHPTKKRRYLK
jgi:hypothetical protein